MQTNYWQFWYGPKVERLLKQAVRRGIFLAGHVLLAEAKIEVPLDKSPLTHSGMVVMHQTEMEACICFGGGAGTGQKELKYAIRWHENNANFQHGRKMRYLADPFNRLGVRLFVDTVQAEINRALP